MPKLRAATFPLPSRHSGPPCSSLPQSSQHLPFCYWSRCTYYQFFIQVPPSYDLLHKPSHLSRITLNACKSIHLGLPASTQICWAQKCQFTSFAIFITHSTAWEIALKGPYYLTYHLQTHSSLLLKRYLLQVPVRPHLFTIPNTKFWRKSINVVSYSFLPSSPENTNYSFTVNPSLMPQGHSALH